MCRLNLLQLNCSLRPFQSAFEGPSIGLKYWRRRFSDSQDGWACASAPACAETYAWSDWSSGCFCLACRPFQNLPGHGSHVCGCAIRPQNNACPTGPQYNCCPNHRGSLLVSDTEAPGCTKTLSPQAMASCFRGPCKPADLIVPDCKLLASAAARRSLCRGPCHP